MNDYYNNDETVKYESSPFSLNSKFEYVLYAALLMSEDELQNLKKK